MFLSRSSYLLNHHSLGWIGLLLIVQLWLGVVTPISMTSSMCNMDHAMMLMDHEHSQTCQMQADHHSMSCQQLCACFNGLLSNPVLPILLTSYVFSLIAHPLLEGIRFSPPLPPP